VSAATDGGEVTFQGDVRQRQLLEQPAQQMRKVMRSDVTADLRLAHRIQQDRGVRQQQMVRNGCAIKSSATPAMNQLSRGSITFSSAFNPALPQRCSRKRFLCPKTTSQASPKYFLCTASRYP
jgi:hypothetical protein